MKNIIGQQDGKRFITDQVAGAPDRVAQTLGFTLARVGNLPRIEGRILQKRQQFGFIFPPQKFFQL